MVPENDIDQAHIIAGFMARAALWRTDGHPDEWMEQATDMVLWGNGVDDRTWFELLMAAVEAVVEASPEDIDEGALYILGDMGFDQLFFRCPQSSEWLRAQFGRSRSSEVMREVMIRWKTTDCFPIDNWD